MSASPSGFDLSDPLTLAQIALVVGYVALVLYAGATGDPLALFAVDVAFAVVMVVFGVLAFTWWGDDPVGILTAATLAGSGVAQGIELATGASAAGAASDLLLAVGLGLYLVRRFRR
ncbi:hypothetical protein [Halegenticoccus soli]|uniref:hypothetical protein n=1 Tax=Halegenticoccus soli TaxID=1985678 RepID=UPI000C6CEC06|nr:hypothetical protein [Halegenticoccus soli]